MSVAEEKILKNANCCFYLSPDSIELHKEIIRKEKIIVQHGIDSEFFTIQKEKDFHGRISIVFTGGLIRPIKGQLFLLEIIKKLNIEVNVYIIGPIDKRNNYYQLFSEINCSSKNIFFYGLCDLNEMIRIYSQAHCVILSSLFETFSIATFEAMAQGVVPIITRKCGIAKYINHCENGFIVDYMDVISVVEHLVNLNNDRELLQAMYKNVKRSVANYDWPTVVKSYYKHLYELN